MYRSVIWPVAVVLLLLFPLSTGAVTTVDLQKARDLMAEGEFKLAADLLMDVPDSDPDQVDALFLLGVCRLNLGQLEEADATLQRVLDLDPGTRKKVDAEFIKAVLRQLNMVSYEVAKEVFELALKYNPELKGDVSKACLDRGKFLLDEGFDDLADDFFRFISIYNGTMKEKICDVLFAKAKAASGEQSLKLLLASMRYGDKYHDETSHMVLNLANLIQDPGRREMHLRRAVEFIGTEKVLLSSVEYYSRAWGPPEKLTLQVAGKWTSFERIKGKGSVRYLCSRDVLTRSEEGPLSLKAALYSTDLFPGLETATEEGYKTQLWFNAEEIPVTVYIWVVD